MDVDKNERRVLTRFKSDTGEEIGNLVDLPVSVTTEQLTSLCNGLLNQAATFPFSVWSMKTKKLLFDLPGHQDGVYAVDWSSDGSKVASGGKDKVLKL
ncbi:unnamed protein product, partial [Nesidiocoris tenuis]